MPVRRNGVRLATFFLLIFIGVPALAHAQSAIAGVVTDATGAVLPGVTVEAASPALIVRGFWFLRSAACFVNHIIVTIFLSARSGSRWVQSGLKSGARHRANGGRRGAAPTQPCGR